VQVLTVKPKCIDAGRTAFPCRRNSAAKSRDLTSQLLLTCTTSERLASTCAPPLSDRHRLAPSLRTGARARVHRSAMFARHRRPDLTHLYRVPARRGRRSTATLRSSFPANAPVHVFRTRFDRVVRHDNGVLSAFAGRPLHLGELLSSTRLLTPTGAPAECLQDICNGAQSPRARPALSDRPPREHLRTALDSLADLTNFVKSISSCLFYKSDLSATPVRTLARQQAKLTASTDQRCVQRERVAGIRKCKVQENILCSDTADKYYARGESDLVVLTAKSIYHNERLLRRLPRSPSTNKPRITAHSAQHSCARAEDGFLRQKARGPFRNL
jgi:hypothetical protein